MSTGTETPNVSGKKRNTKKEKPDFPRPQATKDGQPVTRNSPSGPNKGKPIPVYEDWTVESVKDWTNDYRRPAFDDFLDPLVAVQTYRQKIVPLFLDESTGNGHLFATIKAIFKEEELRQLATDKLASEETRLAAIDEPTRIAEFGARKETKRTSAEAKLMEQVGGADMKSKMEKLLAAQLAGDLATIETLFAEMQADAMAKASGKQAA